MPPSWPSPLEPTDDPGRRDIFNRRRLYARARSGEISTLVVREYTPDPRVGEPDGAVSQIVLYLLDGEPVALVHQYLRPDGTLGASGLPDPKVVVDENGRTLRQQSAR